MSFDRQLFRLALKARLFVSLCSCLLAVGCEPREPAPSTGSNSNWLVACDADAECGNGTSCLCGGCTLACSGDASCGGLNLARCAPAVERAAISACRSDSPASGGGICLPRCEPGSCPLGQACVGGACVLVSVPSSELCLETSDASVEQRSFEEELLDALALLRQTGGVVCGNDAPSVPSPPLRLDGRLICAGRALAADINTTRTQSLIDSRQRTSQDRYRAAGYSPRLWAEGFALRDASASDALAMILSDSDTCPHVIGAGYTDIGAARVGDVSVLSLGSE